MLNQISRPQCMIPCIGKVQSRHKWRDRKQKSSCQELGGGGMGRWRIVAHGVSE
jgi:hypothetical protein